MKSFIFLIENKKIKNIFKTGTISIVLIIFAIQYSFCQSNGWYITPGSPYDYGRFEDIYFLNTNTGWAVKLNGPVFKTTNGGNNWIYLDSLPSQASPICIGFVDANTGWIGTLNNAAVLLKTTNGGYNWNSVTNIPSPVPSGLSGLSIINDSTVYIVGDYESPAFFMKTTNRGSTWLTKSVSAYATTLADCLFFNKDSGFAVGSINNFPNQSKPVVIFTSNAGESWEIKFTGTYQMSWGWRISFPDRINGYISIEKFNSPSIFLKTTNGGDNWSELTFRNSAYQQQGIGFKNSSTGWLGGWSDTTFKTTNGGANWFPAGFGANISKFQFFGDSIGYSAGQYIYKYSDIVGIYQSSLQMPETYYLLQNYPNPFNPNTIINYSIPLNVKSERSNVKLVVYNNIGMEVKTLVNENQSPGSYSVEFEGSNLPSGVYFYRLSSDNFTETKRMVLLK